MIVNNIEVKPTTEQIAEELFNMSDIEIAEVLKLWNKKFEDNLKENYKKPIHKRPYVFDFFMFWLYVVQHLDDELKSIFRAIYTACIYHDIDEIYNNTLIKKSALEYERYN